MMVDSFSKILIEIHCIEKTCVLFRVVAVPCTNTSLFSYYADTSIFPSDKKVVKFSNIVNRENKFHLLFLFLNRKYTQQLSSN